MARAPRRRVVLVGITGPSGIGKTTVANRVATLLASPIKAITLDSFWRQGFDNQSPDAYDSSLLALVLQKLKLEIEEATTWPVKALQFFADYIESTDKWDSSASTVVVIVEGFHLLAYPKVRKKLSLSVMLEADWWICANRRRVREGEWWNEDAYSSWYWNRVWTPYELAKQSYFTNASVSAQGPVAEVVAAVVDICRIECGGDSSSDRLSHTQVASPPHGGDDIAGDDRPVVARPKARIGEPNRTVECSPTQGVDSPSKRRRL